MAAFFSTTFGGAIFNLLEISFSSKETDICARFSLIPVTCVFTSSLNFDYTLLSRMTDHPENPDCMKVFPNADGKQTAPLQISNTSYK